MTRYDAILGHPLAGVPLEVLEVARTTLDDATSGELGADVEVVADRVVAQLHRAGHVTWSRRLPHREDLVLALMAETQDYENDDDDETRSYLEYLVDGVVLPLLRRYNGDSDSDVDAVEGR